MNKNKSITFTAIFKAGSLNYGEGTANISELKKYHRGTGDIYSFASRQSIRYDIVRLGNELFDWNLNVVDKSQGVIQFKADATIRDSVEMDLFGYMKTRAKEGADKRSAVVRLSHAFSLEPYRSDLEFLNNMGLANRIGENANLATIEQHTSLYAYTVTIDLKKIGVDGEIELDQQQKTERVLQFLQITKFLNREIRGRQENLSPLFIIGGIYPIANPFFLGRVSLKDGTVNNLNLPELIDTTHLSLFGNSVKDQTKIGVVSGYFENENEFSQIADKGSVDDFYRFLEEEVYAFYGAERE
ncbi:type I-B CRISPR-associated protein Cas7/Cst2/DevR [Sporolactobacillus sp. CPB3-1]|uniref:Type I-B CRISPR-associated protein Cas7/Cst2/DevR n=1 Tax=Sporolactobacillus mangiferae TaxID=2940498 RepID=A0ABT0MC85_9BACL|nr:type I-B CRISPR-associated protein Cas7/Cst2/DevR [Sporolactobacillus mangiferae]MCL1632492.1 type I-B CRISPR-associated protein Cas7/Cst2/DevR [Sporolactobacillus mangiferae]